MTIKFEMTSHVAPLTNYLHAHNKHKTEGACGECGWVAHVPIASTEQENSTGVWQQRPKLFTVLLLCHERWGDISERRTKVVA